MEYPVITLCGSTRFKNEFMEAQKELTLQGYIVLSVGLFGHSGDSEVWENMDEGTLTKTKMMLDNMHLRKIDMSEEIFVINPGGYIGQSTMNEINYAKEQGKVIRYMDGTPISDVRSFALKWIDKFEDPEIDCDDLLDFSVTDEFHSLGFEMDSGKTFCDKYGQLTSDPRELELFLKDENDIFLIGATLYSFWRYFNHWAYDGSEILEQSNRACFILYLKRLLLLTENDYDGITFSDGKVWHTDD